MNDRDILTWTYLIEVSVVRIDLLECGGWEREGPITSGFSMGVNRDGLSPEQYKINANVKIFKLVILSEAEINGQ